MDIRLKGEMDGIEAAIRIHNTLNTPILYLTAYSDDNTLERARGAKPPCRSAACRWRLKE